MKVRPFLLVLICLVSFQGMSLSVHAASKKKKKAPPKQTVNAKKKKSESSSARYKNIGEPKFGIASYYSTNLHGTKTSTGERYSNNKYTCASNNFKLNTWLRVTNQRNKKSVVVRVNDRMHKRMAARGRVVDLSYIAAKEISMLKAGLVKVKVQQVKRS